MMDRRTNTFAVALRFGAFCLAWTLATMLICSPAIAGTEQAMSANAFVGSMGVNTHFAYSFSSGAYQQSNFSQINTLLIGLGIEHIRDGLTCTYANSPTGTYAAYDNEFKLLAQNGVHASLTSDPRGDSGTQTPAMAVSAIATMNANGCGIECVEGPNELDDAGATFSYEGAVGFPANVTLYQQQLYAAFKGNSNTKSLTVIGPSEGKTYNTVNNPLTHGSMYNYCDVGNFHAYSFGGNYATQHFTYDTINWYEGQADNPGINIDPDWPLDIPVAYPPFEQFNSSGTLTAQLPLWATEKGYFNGTAIESVDAVTMAKYMPRIFADDMVDGIARTYTYELLDDSSNLGDNYGNAGLIAWNSTTGTLTPKPAYYTLQHMIQLLKDSGTSNTTSSLNYTVSCPTSSYPAPYNIKPEYGFPTTIEHLLLQKSNGTFELLLWNDLSSAATADVNGNTLSGTARDIAVPTFPVTVTFTTPVNASATFYGLDPTGTTYATTLDTTAENITNDTITLNVPDYVTILEFTAVPEPAPIAILALGAMGVILCRPRPAARRNTKLTAGLSATGPGGRAGIDFR